MVKCEETEVVPAVLEHVENLVGRLRDEDQKESFAFCGSSADFMLRHGFNISEKCWTGLWRDTPVACFGVVRESMLSDKGIPWLLGTDDIRKVKKPFLLESRKYVLEMMKDFSLLENWVDARNQISIQWLKWCGFSVEGLPQRIGRKGEMFHRFWLRRAV